MGVTKKSILSLFSSFGKEEWSKTEVVGEIMFINNYLKSVELKNPQRHPTTGTQPSRKTR